MFQIHLRVWLRCLRVMRTLWFCFLMELLWIGVLMNGEKIRIQLLIVWIMWWQYLQEETTILCLIAMARLLFGVSTYQRTTLNRLKIYQVLLIFLQGIITTLLLKAMGRLLPGDKMTTDKQIHKILMMLFRYQQVGILI